MATTVVVTVVTTALVTCVTCGWTTLATVLCTDEVDGIGCEATACTCPAGIAPILCNLCATANCCSGVIAFFSRAILSARLAATSTGKTGCSKSIPQSFNTAVCLGFFKSGLLIIDFVVMDFLVAILLRVS